MKEKIKKASFAFDQKNDSILIAEFNYAAQTAFQANEDRVRVFNFVFANLLTLGASLVVPFFNISINPAIFSVVFIIIAIIGSLSIIQLIKLRLAWESSVKVMNAIKQYYIAHSPQIDSVFHWRADTIPKRTGIFNITFMMSFTLMIVNSISLCACLFLYINTLSPLLLAFFGLVLLCLQLILWFRVIK